MQKETIQLIIKTLKKDLTISEICKIAECSNKTVIKKEDIGENLSCYLINV